MDNKGEVCLEEEVEKRRRSGMSVEEISQEMGLQPAWVESIVAMTTDKNEPAKEGEPG